MSKKRITILLTCLLTLSVLMVGVFGMSSVYAENGYYKGTAGIEINRVDTYNYQSIDTTSTVIKSKLPMYHTSVFNKHSGISGAIILGYYDLTIPDLIPNYIAGKNVFGSVNWYDELKGFSDGIATRMNSNSNGISENNFFSGLNGYVTENGYTLNAQSVKGSSGLDMTAVSTSITNKKPIVMFMDTVNFIHSMQDNGNSIALTKKSTYNDISLVVYGYKTITMNTPQGVMVKYILQAGYGIDNLIYVEFELSDSIINSAYSISIA